MILSINNRKWRDFYHDFWKKTYATEPGFPFLIKMSQLFHVSTDYLLGLTEERATTAVDVQSISEQQLIEKYRLLDCTGKELVDYTIAIELKRTTLLENQTNRILHYEQAFNFLKQS